MSLGMHWGLGHARTWSHDEAWGTVWWRGHRTGWGVRSPRFLSPPASSLGLSFLIADARKWPVPTHHLHLASSAQVPKVGSHRLLDGARALHFPRIQEDDSGLYSCRAENQAGTAQKDFDLLVLSE